MAQRVLTAEEQRLEESAVRNLHWKRWGPYLAERRWGTAWEYFPYDHARIAGAKTESPATATDIN